MNPPFHQTNSLSSFFPVAQALLPVLLGLGVINPYKVTTTEKANLINPLSAH
jgi:hypothetical protein